MKNMVDIVPRARVDIKNIGSDENIVLIKESWTSAENGFHIRTPDWFGENGHGVVLHTRDYVFSMTIQCVKSGELNVWLRGEDIRDEQGNGVPYHIFIDQVKVDDENVIHEPRKISHTQPFLYRRKVYDGDVINLYVKWSPAEEYENWGYSVIYDELSDIHTRVMQLQAATADGVHQSMEAVYAHVFHDTIIDSSWLRNKTFSPGRWAVGYQMLYVMYRILDEVRPRSILELGLGQSTKMISQYVMNSGEDVHHTVMEHDPKWIDFFKKQYTLDSTTEIKLLPLKMEEYNGNEVRVYDGFTDAIRDHRYDFIVIDAPMGGDMKENARIDVLKNLPGCLDESFVILMDDTNRSGEMNTIHEMENLLDERGISFASGKYQGNKGCYVIASSELAFLCSM